MSNAVYKAQPIVPKEEKPLRGVAAWQAFAREHAEMARAAEEAERKRAQEKRALEEKRRVDRVKDAAAAFQAFARENAEKARAADEAERKLVLEERALEEKLREDQMNKAAAAWQAFAREEGEKARLADESIKRRQKERAIEEKRLREESALDEKRRLAQIENSQTGTSSETKVAYEPKPVVLKQEKPAQAFACEHAEKAREADEAIKCCSAQIKTNQTGTASETKVAHEPKPVVLKEEKPLTGIAAWQAFAREHAEMSRAADEAENKRVLEERALDEKRRLARVKNNHMMTDFEKKLAPMAFRFYGPGEQATKPARETPVGELRYAVFGSVTWGIEEQPPSFKQGPTDSSVEINWSNWLLVKHTSINMPTAYPGTGLRNASDCNAYLLNTGDFNDVDPNDKQEAPRLKDLIDVPFERLYPKAFKLMKKMSTMEGSREWNVGEPLGTDPRNEEALLEHLGWIMPHTRQMKRGIDADITDPVVKSWKRGDIHVPLPRDFKEPEMTWSKNPARVVTFRSSNGNELKVQSNPALLKRFGKKKQNTTGSDKTNSTAADHAVGSITNSLAKVSLQNETKPTGDSGMRM
ncbi:hypothetical protein AAE478_007471 [Parahypoxylon ruwenzoriense]